MYLLMREKKRVLPSGLPESSALVCKHAKLAKHANAPVRQNGAWCQSGCSGTDIAFRGNYWAQGKA